MTCLCVSVCAREENGQTKRQTGRQKAEGRADMLREQAAREFNMETQETCAKASIDLKF